MFTEGRSPDSEKRTLCVREFNIYTEGSHCLRKRFLGNVAFVKINNQVSTIYLSLYLEYLRNPVPPFNFVTSYLLHKKATRLFKLSYPQWVNSISSHLRWVQFTIWVFPIFNHHESSWGFQYKPWNLFPPKYLTERCKLSLSPFQGLLDPPEPLRSHTGPCKHTCDIISPRVLCLLTRLTVCFPVRSLPFGSCWWLAGLNLSF